MSKFYYLQVATWEQSYRPEWKDLTLLQWARSSKRGGPDSNIMVHKLTGKAWSEKVGEKDLRVAKKILRDHVVVGLLDDAEESFRRFNIVLGIDERLERNERCMNELFSSRENSNTHPKVRSEEFGILYLRHCLTVFFALFLFRRLPKAPMNGMLWLKRMH